MNGIYIVFRLASSFLWINIVKYSTYKSVHSFVLIFTLLLWSNFLTVLEVEYILGKSSLFLSVSKLSIDSHYLNLLNNLRSQSSVIAFILWGLLFQQQCLVLYNWALSFNSNILLEWQMLYVWMYSTLAVWICMLLQTSVNFCHSTWCHIPEGVIVRFHCSEKFRTRVLEWELCNLISHLFSGT